MHLKTEKEKDAFDQDMKTANDLGIAGTPTIYVGGKKFEGKTIDDFDQMVKDAAKGEQIMNKSLVFGWITTLIAMLGIDV